MSSTGTTTTIRGPITAGEGIKTASLDVVSDTASGITALNIGSSVVNGNIVIGSALGVGDIAIAGAQAAGGTVTVGSANTETTLNGIINVLNDVLGANMTIAGKIGYESTNVTYTIPTNINIRYILRITGGTPTITLPTPVRGQYITIRSITANAVSISSATGLILNGQTASTNSITLTTSGSITLYASLTTQYIQI